MSKFEDIVPPLELCQKLKPDDFAESTLVWAYAGNGYEVTSREVWNIVECIFPGISAPTTMEIMAKLPLGTIIQQDAPGVWVCIVHGGEMGVVVEKSGNPATAAMMIWMKIMNQEVGD